MNEEEFLKEHPSLKGKILPHNLGVDIEDIHETQIDKQKVREVIDKKIKQYRRDLKPDKPTPDASYYLDKLKKELKL